MDKSGITEVNVRGVKSVAKILDYVDFSERDPVKVKLYFDSFFSKMRLIQSLLSSIECLSRWSENNKEDSKVNDILLLTELVKSLSLFEEPEILDDMFINRAKGDVFKPINQL